MIKTYVFFLIAILALAAIAPAAADSLWAQGPGYNLCADLRAKNVGDLVTVLVIEETTSTQQAATTYDKDFDHGNAAGVGSFLGLIPALNFQSAQSGSTTGQTTLTSNLATKLTATVTNVMPNGNLEISGERMMETNGEKQSMKLVATVRPRDISPDNTVASTFLADIKCSYTGKGAIGDRQKEGVISKILKFIF
ncbi:MAG: flagellar basal body L-ring protein FlgH [Armatimonadota bacterium]|nr:flagellar basal body L-ring protein FlgH [Armatimonadota bacterium]